MIKAFEYTRVSSKEQEEGYSLAAQGDLIKSYARQLSLPIVEAFSDVETAKKVGRTQFQKLLESLKTELEQGHQVKLLVEKPDRVTRNWYDYVALDELVQRGLEVHFVKQHTVWDRDMPSHQLLYQDIHIALARHYIHNLREEVKKGLHKKADSGVYPQKPPYGYKGENKQIVVVPEKVKFVLRVYKLYASGNFSIDAIPDQMLKEGYVYQPSKPKIPRSSVEIMLKHPFYRGYFDYGGKTYQGKHEVFIPQWLFEQVENVLGQRSFKIVEKDFLFHGLITCEKCGCSVVGELKKGKYIYYHCSNGKRICQRVYVPEKVIQDEVLTVLHRIQPSLEDYEWLKGALKDSSKAEHDFHHGALERLQKEVEKANKLLDRIYDDYLEGILDKTSYERRQRDLVARRDKYTNEIAGHNKADVAYKELGIFIVELAKNVVGLYSQVPYDQKRKILKMALSNFNLDGRKPKLELHYAFETFAQIKGSRKMVGVDGLEPPTLSV